MKSKLLERVVFICCIFFVNSTFSQSNDWEVYHEDEIIKIEYNYTICNFSSTASQELIIFKFTNITQEEITLIYETKMWNNDKQINTEQNIEEFRKTIRLDKNEIITTNCENKWNEYNIFSAFIDNENNERYPYLTRFELYNLTTKNE